MFSLFGLKRASEAFKGPPSKIWYGTDLGVSEIWGVPYFEFGVLIIRILLFRVLY